MAFKILEQEATIKFTQLQVAVTNEQIVQEPVTNGEVFVFERIPYMITVPVFVVSFTVTDEITMLPVQGATVTFDGQTGQTNQNGQVSFPQIIAGSYQYTVSKSLYDEVSGSVDVVSSNVEVDVTFVRLRFSILFTVLDQLGAPLTGATVTIGEDSYLTDENGEAEFKSLLSDTYNYSITKANYITINGQATIVDSDITVDQQMQLAVRNVTFTVTDTETALPVSSAAVTLNGVTQNTNAQGVTTFLAIPVGTYPYTVTKDVYYSISSSVNVSSSDVNVSVDFQPASILDEIRLFSNAINTGKTPTTTAVGTASVGGGASFASSVLMKDGRVLLLPSNKSQCYIYDPVANTTTAAGTAGIGGSGAFVGGVLLPSGKVLMSPDNKSQCYEYDPVANTTLPVGTPNIGFSDNFVGCVLMNDGRVLLVPYNKGQCYIYDPVANTTTAAGNSGLGTAAFGGGVLLTDGKVLLVPYSKGQCYVYNPVANTTTAVGNSGLGSAAFTGGVLLPSGKVLLVPRGQTQCYVYDPVANTTVAVGTPNIAGSNAFAGGVLMPDGKVLLVPFSKGQAYVYDPVANTTTAVGSSGHGLFAFYGGILMRDGRVLLNPFNRTQVYAYNSYLSKNYRTKTLESNYLNKL